MFPGIAIRNGVGVAYEKQIYNPARASLSRREGQQIVFLNTL
jgi:hypothetical protein